MNPRLTKLSETFASIGLIIVLGAMVAPIFNLVDLAPLHIYKWIYAGGALLFTVARVVGATDSEGNFRLRRLRRMECWAGFAFIIGAALWFYQEGHLGPYAGPLAVLRNTITLSLVGAILQIVAGVMISRLASKQQADQ